MSYDSLLNLTCTIKERTTSFSETRASTVTYANKVTGEPCAIQPFAGGMVSREESEELNITHLGFFRFSADIVATNKVVVSDGTEYIVKRFADAAGRGRHKEVPLELLKR